MQYVIWDFDGTLAFRAGKWSGTLIEVLQQEMPAHPATVHDIRPHMQTGFRWNRHEQAHAVRSADEWWEEMWPVFENAFREGAKVTADDAQRLARQVRSAYLRPDAWQLFDDTLPCLNALRATGWRHVILSNHVPELPDIVGALGLAPLIDRVFNSAQTGFEKPHAEAFAKALSSIQNADRIWMIGDSVTADIAGAQAAGLRTVLVRSEHPAADHCCPTLAEIPALLNRF